MELYDEDVVCWLINHNAFFLFCWGLCVCIASLILMPFEIYWNIRCRIKYNYILGKRVSDAHDKTEIS